MTNRNSEEPLAYFSKCKQTLSEQQLVGLSFATCDKTQAYPPSTHGKVMQKLRQYSHRTEIVAVASSDPILFSTLHLYITPSSPLVRLGRCRVLDVESKLLLPCFVQAMLGGGLPVALQNRITSSPSTTC